MSVVRGLATDPDAAVRRAAYDAELAAWDTVAVPLAAALNAFKGEANALNRRRGWDDSLDPALFTNNVDRAPSTPCRRRSWRRCPTSPATSGPRPRCSATTGGPARGGTCSRRSASAARLRLAPRPPTPSRDAFATLLARARGARRAGPVAEGWIDAEPRAGKVGGAFCMPVAGRREPRAAQLRRHVRQRARRSPTSSATPTTTPTSADRTPMQRQTPMALAETASIFCETIMVQAGLAAAGDDAGGRLALLDGDLAGATPGRRRHPLAGSCSSGRCAPSASRRRAVGRPAARADARGAARRLRRRARPRPPPPRHVGGEGPLLHRLLQLAVHVRPAVRHRPLRRVPARPRAVPARLRRPAVGHRASAKRPSWPPGSASTCRSTGFWTASLDVLRGRIDDYVELAARAAA